jgi:hypothetical protein
MSEEKLRSANRWAIWLAVAITLGPLVVMVGDRPSSQPAPAKVGYEVPIQPALAAVCASPQSEVRV